MVHDSISKRSKGIPPLSDLSCAHLERAMRLRNREIERRGKVVSLV